MIIDVVPVAKPRMTQRDRWKQRPSVLAYRAYADALRLAHPHALPDVIELVFYLPMPRSWSARKRGSMLNQPHRVKPDLDNLVKGFLDVLHPRDQEVWRYTAEKRWGERGRVEVSEWH